MNKILTRVLSITVLSTLLFSSLPIASDISYAAATDKQEKKQTDITDKRKKKLKDEYSISVDDLQGILDQGYTLDDAEKALKDQKKTKGDIKASLDKVKPGPVNKSKEAVSEVTSSLGEKSYATSIMMSATNPPDPIPDYSYVNTHPDEAPYSIQLDQETISTLSGGLSMQAADMSLPGRNGLGFTLSRSYDSGSSQLNQMVSYGSYSGTVQPNDEKLFPIGKGWTWNISYVEISGSNKFLHIGGSGVYKIDASNNLVGYPWKDLTFVADTTLSVNGISSAYVLKSLQLINQYFSATGQLLQISDSYNNKVTFNYASVPTYGSVLSTITDAIGNTITITYSTDSVVLTKGSQVVTYYKTTQNGKELLSQVVDAVGRATTYDYSLKDAMFSLTGTTPNTSNPYALLTGVTHPTGSKSVYKYEDTATTRFTGLNSVNQVYRVKSREDQFTKTDGTTETVNHKEITYPTSDIGSTYNPPTATPLVFSVAVDNSLNKTTFTNKKVYFDENTPSVFYNTKVDTTSIYGGKTYTNTTDYTYDEARRWTSPITTKVTKAESGNTNTNVTNISQSYNDYGSVLNAVNVLGDTTTYTYDPASHLLTGVSIPLSATQTQYTEYVRNPDHGNVTTVRVRDVNETGPVLQETINESYDEFGNAWQTRVKKDATQYISFQTEYNAAAPYLGAYPTKQTIAVKDAEGLQSTIFKQYDYNTANGQLKKYTDGKTYDTSYDYDAVGRVVKATHPDNSFVKVDYFDFQNQVQQTDETGVKTVTKWNPLGWKIDAGINDGGIYKSKAKYGYDAYGRITWTEDALGNSTSYGYDQWSRQNVISYPDTSTASVLYDDINNTKVSTDAEGYSIKELTDKVGRVTSKEETKKLSSGGTKTTVLGTFTFDKAGHVLTSEDNQQPVKNKTTYNYNTVGQLTSVLNAKNEATSYQYDNLGNMLQVTYPDNKTNLKKYDEIGRLIQTTDANSKEEKYFYDKNGNQTGLKDRNGTYFRYTFDNRNFLTKKEITNALWVPLAGEEVISFSYDLAGRRKQMTDITGTTSYDYVPSTGVLNTQTYADGKTIKYDYDAAGNRFVMNDPFGVNTYYHYDARNRLDIVAPSPDFLKDTESNKTTDYDARYTYYNNNLIKNITQKNGVTSDFSYDGLRIGSLTEKKSNGTTLNTFAYTYDNNGNQQTKTEQVGAIAVTSNNFTYDQLNRISTSDQFNEGYGYDNRGNRSSMTTNNPFESPDATRTFDKRDRLRNVALTSGGNISYKYNGDGLLWERTENGQTTRYYLDGDQVIAEGNVVGGVATLKARYIRGQGLIAREDGQGKAYYLQNGHGDVVNLMDSTGTTKLNSYSYDVFGNIVSQQENLPQQFKYSGEMMDDKVGLQYLRARWYDPSMGRFVGEDTYGGQINNPLSQNRFTYVENNPLTNIDPTGHCPMCIIPVVANPATWAYIGAAVSAIAAGIGVGKVISSAAPKEAPTVSAPSKPNLYVIDGGIGNAQPQNTKSNPSPIPIYDPNKDKDRDSKNIVYRALTPYDKVTVDAGWGIFSKYWGVGGWSLTQHILNNDEEEAKRNDPWISTSTSLDVARRFNSGNGIVAIDLNKVMVDSEVRFPSVELAGSYDPNDIAAQIQAELEQEVSVKHRIYSNAILGYVK